MKRMEECCEGGSCTRTEGQRAPGGVARWAQTVVEPAARGVEMALEAEGQRVDRTTASP